MGLLKHKPKAKIKDLKEIKPSLVWVSVSQRTSQTLPGNREPGLRRKSLASAVEVSHSLLQNQSKFRPLNSKPHESSDDQRDPEPGTK